MPKQIPGTEMEAILQMLGRFQNGAAIADLCKSSDIELPRRTLQRRLARLVEDGRLERSGAGPAARYHVPGRHKSTATIPLVIRETTAFETSVPLSDAATEIQAYVQQPLQARRSVGHNVDFLTAYRPNRTFYLDRSTRSRLQELGRPANEIHAAGTYAKKLYHRLLLDLTWNSSRLEGNTYSLLETDRLLHAGQSAGGKDARETQMILNHKAAIDLLVEAPDEIAFNRYTICNLHALLAENLLPDLSACGRLRSIPVGIGGSVYTPTDNPVHLDSTFQSLLDKAEQVQDPFEQSFFSMVHLPYLQPFEDVNKRVSRLAANIPFIRMNLSPLSFVDVPERIYIDGLLGIYELNRFELLRDLFVWAYERSCRRYSTVRQVLGEPDPFRMRYRELMLTSVSEVVRSRLDKGQATDRIKAFSLVQVPVADQQRFIEAVETELLSLHEGNIARYRLRPAEFQDWQRQW